MPKHAQVESGRSRTRTVVAAGFGLGVLSLTGAGVYAGLTAEATNTSAQAVTSGTLKLELDASGQASIATAVANMAPGDTENRYAVLSNTGSLAGKGLGLKVVGTGSNRLTNTTAEGLNVTVKGCSGPWVVATNFCSAAPLTPLVPGTTTTYVSSTKVASLGTTVPFTGSIDPAAGAAYNLQVTLTLDGTENVLNGSLPVDTMQGLTTNLTYTFSETQRDATTAGA